MALMKCPECGKDVSERAGFCPHCGLDSPRVDISKFKDDPIQHTIATILTILFLIFMGWLFNRVFFS